MNWIFYGNILVYMQDLLLDISKGICKQQSDTVYWHIYMKEYYCVKDSKCLQKHSANVVHKDLLLRIMKLGKQTKLIEFNIHFWTHLFHDIVRMIILLAKNNFTVL